MSDKNDFQEFSEDAAVKFIRERLSEDVASRGSTVVRRRHPRHCRCRLRLL